MRVSVQLSRQVSIRVSVHVSVQVSVRVSIQVSVQVSCRVSVWVRKLGWVVGQKNCKWRMTFLLKVANLRYKFGPL
jgi:hypothetical protein